MKIDIDKCIGCGYCVRDCPVDAVKLVKVYQLRRVPAGLRK
jgi:ferredoxin